MAILVSRSIDLVYLDPPYFSRFASTGTNYLVFYHFLEGLSDYGSWPARIGSSHGRIRRIPDTEEISRFTCRSKILYSFGKLLEHFQDNIIVLSYQSDGIPSRDERTYLLILRRTSKSTQDLIGMCLAIRQKKSYYSLPRSNNNGSVLTFSKSVMNSRLMYMCLISIEHD